jgi:hypothetical protein
MERSNEYPSGYLGVDAPARAKRANGSSTRRHIKPRRRVSTLRRLALNGERIHRSYTLNAFRLKPSSSPRAIPTNIARSPKYGARPSAIGTLALRIKLISRTDDTKDNVQDVSSTRGMPRDLFGRNDLVAAHSKAPEVDARRPYPFPGMAATRDRCLDNSNSLPLFFSRKSSGHTNRCCSLVPSKS